MKPAILIYGYNRKDADTIYSSISDCLNKPPDLISTNGKKSETIENLLSSTENTFKQDDTKIIMFANIDDSGIQLILRSFPPSVNRPIFCGLTPHNKTWTFTTLKEHLLKEQAYWQQQKEKS